MVSTWLSVLAIGMATCWSVCASQNYKESGYLNNQYGTKTGYFWSNSRQSPQKDALISASLEGHTCSAIHVNIVSRHGARYTSAKDMRGFTNLKNKLEETFTNKSYSFINTWVNTYPEDQAELVTPLGQEEMFYLGELYGTELHSLLSGTVEANGHLNDLRFSATRKPRTQESADWFFRGFSNVLIGQNLTNLKPEVRDNILRFYDGCNKYDEETSNMTELYKFENGAEFQTMIKQIETVLGTNVSLTIDDVKLMYRLCATELAVMNNADWCTLQTDEHREILEYDNDIEDYISRLYGYQVTQDMTCPLFNDVFSNMADAIKAQTNGHSSYKKGVFQFGHSDTVVDFAGALGLFKDSDSIRSDNYATMRNRKFRASTVDPFSTHIAFIIYKCAVDSATDKYAVQMRYNDQPMAIPACGSDICWFDDVWKYYQHYIEQCNWQNVCNPPPTVVG